MSPAVVQAESLMYLQLFAAFNEMRSRSGCLLKPQLLGFDYFRGGGNDVTQIHCVYDILLKCQWLEKSLSLFDSHRWDKECGKQRNRAVTGLPGPLKINNIGFISYDVPEKYGSCGFICRIQKAFRQGSTLHLLYNKVWQTTNRSCQVLPPAVQTALYITSLLTTVVRFSFPPILMPQICVNALSRPFLTYTRKVI